MADEQAATNDDDHFVKPKIPFRKPLVDLSGKLEHKVITSTPVFKTPTSNQPQTSGQESAPKKIPNALTQIKPPKKVFYLEEIKDGTVCKRHYLNNNINTLGRATDCDIMFDHPSISRYHAALYWKEHDKKMDHNGFFYLTDLNSSHGTSHNKAQLEHSKFLLLQPNKSFIKLGASSRLLLFSCLDEEASDEDAEEETQADPTNPYVAYFKNLKEKSQQVTKERYDLEEDCCTWGMITPSDLRTSSAVPVESGLQVVLSILNQNTVIDRTENENAYAQNPQKSIQHWFEYEGYEYEYTVANENNKFKCTISFPIEDQHVPIAGEDEIKKKDAINSACLRACKVLDKAGILFSWQKSSRTEKRKQNSDDEDDLLDETGEKESKRARLAALKSKKAENLETLTKRLDELKAEIDKLNVELAELDKQMSASRSGHKATSDELDQYMQSVSANSNYSMNDLKIKKSRAKMKMGQLVREKERIERLIKIAQPSPNTFLSKHSSPSATSKVSELIEKAKAKLNKKKEEESTVVIEDDEKIVTGKVIEVNLGEKLAEQQPAKTSLSFNKPAAKVLPKVDLGGVEEEKRSRKKELILIDSDDEDDDSLEEVKQSAAEIDPEEEETGTVQAGKTESDEANESVKQHEVRCQPKSQPKGRPSSQTGDLPKKQAAKTVLRRDEEEEIEDADKYVEWVPPEEQETIDSRSHLNDKYGY